MNSNTKDQSFGQTQHKIARVTGLLFLLFITLSVLHYTLIELNLIVNKNTVEIAAFIKSNELLFRSGIALDLILFICVIILSFLLYTLLKPFEKKIALLAFIWMLIQAVISILIELSSFFALLLLNKSGDLAVFEIEQIQALLGLILNARANGYSVAILFFNLGCITYFFCFLKSKYIPRILALSGIVLFMIMLALSFIQIILPNSYIEKIGQTFSVFVMLLLVTVGMWLLIKGGLVKNSEEEITNLQS